MPLVAVTEEGTILLSGKETPGKRNDCKVLYALLEVKREGEGMGPDRRKGPLKP